MVRRLVEAWEGRLLMLVELLLCLKLLLLLLLLLVLEIEVLRKGLLWVLRMGLPLDRMDLGLYHGRLKGDLGVVKGWVRGEGVWARLIEERLVGSSRRV